MRILIADDNEGVRRRMRALIASRPDWELCAEVVDGQDAIAKARSARPHVIILGAGLSRINGLEAAPLIKRELPESKILFLGPNDAAQTQPLGANPSAQTFIPKETMRFDLLAAIDDLVGRDNRSSATPDLRAAATNSRAVLPTGFEFLAGAGEMGRLIREYNWSETPLGPIEGWRHVQDVPLQRCLHLSAQSRKTSLGFGPAGA